MLTKSVGRGCVRNFAAEERAREDRRRKERQVWLATAEGITWQLAEAKRLEELRIAAEIARQEQRLRQAWDEEVARVRDTADVAGLLVRADDSGACVESSKFNGRDTFFTWRYFKAEYPLKPEFVLRRHQKRDFGLRCLLIQKSINELKERYPDHAITGAPIRGIRIIGFSTTGKSAWCEVTMWGN